MMYLNTQQCNPRCPGVTKHAHMRTDEYTNLPLFLYELAIYERQ